MVTCSQLAGFFAAHAIWCVSDGGTLIPMLAYTTADGGRQMNRFAGGDLVASVGQGKQKLDSNEMDAVDAALLYDARIPVGAEKLDAVIVEMRAYFSPGSEAVMAIPYTPKSPGPFRVHKPKLLAWKDCDDFDMSAAFEAFFRGVAEHDKGAKIWNDHLDESR